MQVVIPPYQRNGLQAPRPYKQDLEFKSIQIDSSTLVFRIDTPDDQHVEVDFRHARLFDIGGLPVNQDLKTNQVESSGSFSRSTVC
jgi:hypothetical protein